MLMRKCSCGACVWGLWKREKRLESCTGCRSITVFLHFFRQIAYLAEIFQSRFILFLAAQHTAIVYGSLYYSILWHIVFNLLYVHYCDFTIISLDSSHNSIPFTFSHLLITATKRIFPTAKSLSNKIPRQPARPFIKPVKPTRHSTQFSSLSRISPDNLRPEIRRTNSISYIPYNITRCAQQAHL